MLRYFRIVLQLILVAAALTPGLAHAEQSRESMANDATAAQWSFQFAYQSFPNYYTDEIAPGIPRAKGVKDFFQVRVVAPLPKSDSRPFMVLPRVTLRHATAQNNKTGLQPTEVFALVILKDWGTGRYGVGPLLNLPASNSSVGNTKWSYGLSAAAVNTSGKLFYGALFTQAWGEASTGPVLPQPLGVATFLFYSFPQGFYVSNGDMVALYDWQNQKFFLPVAIRAGKSFVREKDTFNFYVEYQTSAVYEEWLESAIKDSYRVNLSYTIPIGP